MAVILCWTVIPVSGMEMGGFDVQIGAGEQSDFSFVQEEQSGGSVSETSGNPGTDGNSQNSTQIQSQGSVQNFGQESVTSDVSVFSSDAYSGSASGEKRLSDSGVQSSSVISQQGQIMLPVREPAGDSAREPTQGAINEQTKEPIKTPTKESAQKTIKEPTINSAKEPTKEPTTKSAKKPTKEPTKEPTPKLITEPPELNDAPAPVASETPVPSPALLFYDNNSVQMAEKTGLCVKYWKEETGTCENPGFQIVSDVPFYILSARINHRECLWKWQGEYLFLEGGSDKKNNSVELIILYEDMGDARCEITPVSVLNE